MLCSAFSVVRNFPLFQTLKTDEWRRFVNELILRLLNVIPNKKKQGIAYTTSYIN